MYTSHDHSFVICSYKDNPYLEQCILSLKNQTVTSNIILSTSTPTQSVKLLALKYNIELVTNPVQAGTISDWNFAYSYVSTKLVTLCHQDDYYSDTYLDNILSYANRAKSPIILFTNYFEDRNGQPEYTNGLLRVKRLMNFPLQFQYLWTSRWVRRRILSFGCPICCPSVTFNKEVILGLPFIEGYKNNMDWQAWERLSKLAGDFVYCPKQLMAHRIWTGSLTSAYIKDASRSKEDYEMFCKFWPSLIAKILFHIYENSQSNNTLRKLNSLFL